MQGGWLVPLNIHQSLALRSIAANSRQLQSISSSLGSLTVSIRNIEESAIELSGTADAILDLLQSGEHRDSTIAGMRSLIFSHRQTCRLASKEDDALTAMSSCIVSEKLLNQPWFNMELFSHASFEEMNSAVEMIEYCEDTMDEIKSRLNEDESEMIEVLIESLDRLEHLESEMKELASNFDSLNGTNSEREGWSGGGRWHLERSSKSINLYFRHHRAGKDRKCVLFTSPKSTYREGFHLERTGSPWIPSYKALDLWIKSPPSSQSQLRKLEKSVDQDGRPDQYNRRFCRDALREADKLYDAHDEWKSLSDSTVEESIINSANETFNGRLNIEHFRGT